MNKYIWLVAILAVIIIILLGVLAWPKPSQNQQQNLQVGDGIEITLPIANTEITSPLKITGKVTGNGWAGFEGQVGTVKLLDSKGTQLGQTAILTATTEWTSLPTNFETTINFTSTSSGPATLVFSNENPSGDPVRDKTFSLPVIIKASEAISVKAYFNNNKLDPAISCNKVFAVGRDVLKTEAVARAALEELLKGPTQTEKDAGFSTSINTGVKIQSLTITNGVAKVDFDEQLQFQVGGSCKVSAIRAQITQTLLQFPTIKNVIISINGETEDILQP